MGGDTTLVGMGNFGIDVKNAYFGVRGDLAIKVEGGTLIETAGKTSINSGETARLNAPRFIADAVVDLGGEGGMYLHRRGDQDSDGDVAVGAASKVRAV